LVIFNEYPPSTTYGGAGADIEVNGVWETATLITPPNSPVDAGEAALTSVSCPNVGLCYAVGTDANNEAYVVEDSDGAWGTAQVISGSGPLASIDCPTPNDCTAVGNGTSSILSNGMWTTSSVPAINMSSVSCVDPTDCTATGSNDYATETNGAWGTPATIGGFPAGTADIEGVSCTGTTNCTAVGNDGNTDGIGQPFYVTSQPALTGQAPLTLTSTNGVYGQALTLTTTGGSGAGAISYAVTDGTASGCTVYIFALTSTSTGTCIVTATKAADATYDAVTSPPTPVTFGQANQVPLTVTSTSGVSGNALTLTFGGGSGTGAVSFAITDGTAAGCTIYILAITSTGPGTCIVTVTKAGDANYDASSSAPTTVTFSAPTPPSKPKPSSTPPPVISIPPLPTTTPTTTDHRYWLVGSDGGIFTFGAARFYGSTGDIGLQRPVVGITPTAGDGGYWLVASDGGVFSFGDTQFYGSIPGLGISPAGSGQSRSLAAPIVGIVPTVDDHGYFMVGADGGVFAFGDAKFEGSCPEFGGCSGTAVAVMPDASGNGYWLVTNTGHVYAFGDAIDYGQPDPQLVPVTNAVRTTDGKGYWLLYANGAVAAFGDAPYFTAALGEVGGIDPATAILTTSDGGGVWIVSANGSVFAYGDAPNDGGMGGLHLNGAIIAGTGW